MGLKDLFRRNKDDDEDEDFDDDDFDATDFEDEADSDEDSDAASGAETADAGDADDGDPGFGGSTLNGDNGPDSTGPDDQGLSDGEGNEDPFGTDDMVTGGGDDASDADVPGGEGGDDLDEDMPDFGDDDDDGDYEDEDYDEDDEDEDEDEDYEDGLLANPIVLFSAIVIGFLVVLGGIGFGAWYFISSGEEELAGQVSVRQEGALSPPPVESGVGGLNEFASVDDRPPQGETVDSAPVAAPVAESAQIAGGTSLNEFSNVGGLNALAGGGLNAVATGSATAAGLIIPASTMIGYDPYVDYPTPSPLPRAPDLDFVQVRGEDEIPLPMIAADGRVPWKFYGRPLVPDSGIKRVALLITGMGLSTAETLAAIKKLPPEVTLSFSPYADDLEQWLLRSRRVGHEVMLGLPLESARFPIEDPGPLALRTDMSPASNLALTEELLSLFQGYTGLEVMMGSKSTASELHVRNLLDVLNGRGLMIMDGAWNTRSKIPKVAGELGMPRIISDVRLDSVMALSAIDAKLKELDTLILTRSQAVATTGMSPAVMDRLKTWFQTLPGRGVELVPISTLVDTTVIEPPEP